MCARILYFKFLFIYCLCCLVSMAHAERLVLVDVPTEHAVPYQLAAELLVHVPINEIHSWQINWEGLEGVRSEILISGGMEAHGHALPTEPVLTRQSNSTVIIHGLKFQMPGEWFIALRSADTGKELLKVEFEVRP